MGSAMGSRWMTIPAMTEERAVCVPLVTGMPYFPQGHGLGIQDSNLL